MIFISQVDFDSGGALVAGTYTLVEDIVLSKSFPGLDLITSFIFDGSGNIESELFNFEERIEIRLKRKVTYGRVRMNCTAKDRLGNWRWFGHQFIMPKYLSQ